jgi:hypothetical protein
MDYFFSSLPYPDFPLTSIYMALRSKTPTVIMPELLADSNLAENPERCSRLAPKRANSFEGQAFNQASAAGQAASLRRIPGDLRVKKLSEFFSSPQHHFPYYQ